MKEPSTSLGGSVRTAMVIALLAVSAFSGCDRESGAGSGIEPYHSEIRLSSPEQLLMLEAARVRLAGAPLPSVPANLRHIAGAGAVVEVHLPPVAPIVTVVGGGPFTKALARALGRTADSRRFVSEVRPALDRARIKLSILTNVTPLPFDARADDATIFGELARRIEPGVDGLVLAHSGRTYWQLPEAVIYEGWALKSGRNLLLPRIVARQVGELSRTLGEDQQKNWRDGKLFAFTTFSFIESAGEPRLALETRRAKFSLPPLTPVSLRAAAIANADYLASVVDEKGRFRYLYHPEKDIQSKGYNVVRHAAATTALFDAYNRLRDPKYAAAGRRALDYLVSRIEVPSEAPEIAIVVDRGESKLGTNALAAMTYAMMPEELLTEKDRELRVKLGQSLLDYRMPEKGLFYTTFRQVLDKSPPARQARYFPGEAMLALVRLYERTGEARWWESAKDIASGQASLWKEAGHRSSGNFCWVGQAFARMARIEKDPTLRERYRDVGYSHADAVVLHQFGLDEAPYPDYVGGAGGSRPPRTTPTSARAESLAENFLTARQFGDVEAQRKYGVALLRAIHFCVENQFTEQNGWFLRSPGKALGGIRGSLIANDIRIDYNQHLLSAMLNALDAIEALDSLGVKERRDSG